MARQEEFEGGGGEEAEERGGFLQEVPRGGDPGAGQETLLPSGRGCPRGKLLDWRGQTGCRDGGWWESGSPRRRAGRAVTRPIPLIWRAGSGRRKARIRPRSGGRRNWPSGLLTSEQSFARRRFGATPAEHVRRVAERTSARRRAAASAEGGAGEGGNAGEPVGGTAAGSATEGKSSGCTGGRRGERRARGCAPGVQSLRAQ